MINSLDRNGNDGAIQRLSRCAVAGSKRRRRDRCSAAAKPLYSAIIAMDSE